MNVPSTWRACSQLNSAVRAMAMWRLPVGAGENRRRGVTLMRLRPPALHHPLDCAPSSGPPDLRLAAQQLLRDHDPLDLVRAFVDLRDLGVTHEAFRRQ